MVLPVLGTRFRNFQVQPCRTTTSISEVVFKLVLDPHRQQVRGPGILDTEEHVSPDSSHRKRPAVELLSKQEAKSRRSKHPRSRSRGQRFREASSKSRSLSSDDHIQPVLHAPSCKLPPRPSSPPPGFVGFIHIIHTHQPNPAISRMMERLTHRSGGSHPRAHMRTPQHQQQRHCFPLLQHQQKVAIHALIQCPFMFQNSGTDPYVYMQATTKAAPPLPGRLATRFAPGHWGRPAQMLESLRQTTDTAVETLRRKLQDRSRAGRQQLVTPAHNAPLPPPPPPPPPAIPIPTATATQSTPLTTQLTAHTNANQQHSSAVLASSHAPQQFLPQRLGVSQQEIPLLQQTVPAFWVLMGRPVHPTHNFLEQGRQFRNWQMMEQVPLVDAEQVASQIVMDFKVGQASSLFWLLHKMNGG